MFLVGFTAALAISRIGNVRHWAEPAAAEAGITKLSHPQDAVTLGTSP
jgi:hypothetical protein